MAQRKATIERKTNETDIRVALNLDGQGRYAVNTGVGFFDHMLAHLSKHSRIDMTVQAEGDLEVDAHHTIEDVGIAIGQALDEALGDKKGIARYGHSVVPMEDARAEVAVDLSGRPYLVYHVSFKTEKIGDFDVECVEEFLRSFSTVGKFNLHVESPCGLNSHHIAEAVFKALGQALGAAVKVIGTDIPSTKGTL
ncbi:MAG: imidazoleglycerol-phosphate dehydratase HisB [Planctomycetes bacterium]|jgi:imidazoleglycerol-phosphate dehydratase|nr:imidazoleglycerol-phosphate dehydratase HisB [Planctomycetota bacterium]